MIIILSYVFLYLISYAIALFVGVAVGRAIEMRARRNESHRLFKGGKSRAYHDRDTRRNRTYDVDRSWPQI